MSRHPGKMIALLAFLGIFGFWSCSSEGTDRGAAALHITVAVDIATSPLADQPAVIETVDAITLTFSRPLLPASAAAHVAVYRVKAGGNLEIIPCRMDVLDNRITLSREDLACFKEGEEYRLLIRKGILSTAGQTLAQDFIGYFATTHSFTLEDRPLTGLKDPRAAIVCISDLHLGDERSIDGGYGWIRENRASLADFLNKLRFSPNIRELVIAGDLFDEWVAPMQVLPLNHMTQAAYVDSIAQANADIVEAFRNIIQDGIIKVTYVPGNHDMLVTPADIARIFPGINQARDSRGLGTYAPLDRPEIIIEHGHRYDFYNAPDPFSNRNITGTDSILPPGFFVSKIAASSDMEKAASSLSKPGRATGPAETACQNNYLLYLLAWDAILWQKPVKESPSASIIATDIDGYKTAYAINDLVPYDSGGGILDVTLYKNIQDTWPQRQDANQVPVHIPTAEAIAAGALDIVLDAQALRQYLTVPGNIRKIIVFGHTHKAIIIKYSDYQAVYINSGTWIDNGSPSPTLAVIIPPQETSATGHVLSYLYLKNGELKKLDEAVVTY